MSPRLRWKIEFQQRRVHGLRKHSSQYWAVGRDTAVHSRVHLYKWLNPTIIQRRALHRHITLHFLLSITSWAQQTGRLLLEHYHSDDAFRQMNQQVSAKIITDMVIIRWMECVLKYRILNTYSNNEVVKYRICRSTYCVSRATTGWHG